MNPDDSAFDDIALRAFLRFGSAIGVLEEPELYPNLLDVVFELIPAQRTAIRQSHTRSSGDRHALSE